MNYGNLAPFLKKVPKNQRKKKMKIIYFLIYSILSLGFFSIIHQGLTFKVISMHRRGLSPYIIYYDKEPNLFLFSLTFSILIVIMFTYIFIESLKLKKSLKLTNLLPSKEKTFHIFMFLLITSPVIFIFLSIILK